VTAISSFKANFKVVAGRLKLVSAWTVILPFILNNDAPTRQEDKQNIAEIRQGTKPWFA
jgi:hypothetical protein